HSETIYWYYEFGLALTIRLNELLENGQKRVQKRLNDKFIDISISHL
ncbi:7195_t:CDS:1, partial [Acaulospora colombiana]